jgi:ribosomal protein S18 acetylase RimI-like enzyme
MIIEYKDEYIEQVRDLLIELEEYIVQIDKDNLDVVGKDYREKYVLNMLKDVRENNGKVFLYMEENKVLGLVAGVIRKYDDSDYLDYKCPKAGRVIELITTKKQRSKGIGKMLLNHIENYFKENMCEYVYLEVFAYNDNAINFYENNDYHARMHDLIKKI